MNLSQGRKNIVDCAFTTSPSLVLVLVVLGSLGVAEPMGFWAHGDNHFHSKYSDGNRWPPDQKQVLIKRGLRYAILTDHTCLLPQDGRQPQIHSFNGWDEVLELSDENLLWVQGAEYTNAHGYRHTCCLPIYPPAFYPHMNGFTDFGNEGMMHREVHRIGGFVVLAHPANDVMPWTSYNFDGVNVDSAHVYDLVLGTHARGMETLLVADSDAHTLEQLAGGGCTALFVPSLTWEDLRDAHLARHACITWDASNELLLTAWRGNTYLGMQGDSVICRQGETLQFRLKGRLRSGTRRLRLTFITGDNPVARPAAPEAIISGGTFEHTFHVTVSEDRIFYGSVDTVILTNHLRVKVEGKPDWNGIAGTWRWQDDRYEQTDTGTVRDPGLMKANTRGRVLPFEEQPVQVSVKATIVRRTGNPEERIGLIGHRSFFPNSLGDRALVLARQQLWLLEEGISWGPGVPFPYDDGDVLWFKLRMDGDWVQGRVWRDGETEPEEWLIQRPFSDHEFQSGGPTGHAGLYAARAHVAFDDFAVVDDRTGEVLFVDTFNTSGPTPLPSATATWRPPDSSPTPPGPPPPGGNLLLNAGAELGSATGWTVAGLVRAVTSAPARAAPPIRPHSGDYFFQLGPSTSPVLSWSTDLGAYAEDRDRGVLEFVAGLWSTSATDYDDDPIGFMVRQYGPSGELLDSRSSGWMYDWFRGRWNRYAMAGRVHPWATRIELVLLAKPQGSQSTAYADDVYFYLRTGEARLMTLQTPTPTPAQPWLSSY